jgi:hypothetical protein
MIIYKYYINPQALDLYDNFGSLLAGIPKAIEVLEDVQNNIMNKDDDAVEGYVLHNLAEAKNELEGVYKVVPLIQVSRALSSLNGAIRFIKWAKNSSVWLWTKPSNKRDNVLVDVDDALEELNYILEDLNSLKR